MSTWHQKTLLYHTTLPFGTIAAGLPPLPTPVTITIYCHECRPAIITISCPCCRPARNTILCCLYSSNIVHQNCQDATPNVFRVAPQLPNLRFFFLQSNSCVAPQCLWCIMLLWHYPGATYNAYATSFPL